MRTLPVADLPDFLILIVYPFCSLLAMLTLAFIFKHVIKTYESDSSVIDTATQGLTGGAYFILGFALILVMGTSDKYQSNLQTEAIQIESLDRLLLLDGSTQAQSLRKNLLVYTESIVADEWPQLVLGRESTKTTAYIEEIIQKIQNLDPQTPKQSILYADIIRKADLVINSREERVLNGKGSLPELFWLLSNLCLIAIITISALRVSHATRIRTITLSIQVVMISVLYAIVMIINHPYSGETKISPEPLKKAAEALRAQHAVALKN